MAITAVAFDFGGVLTWTSLGGVQEYGTTLGLPADGLTRYFRGDPMMARLEVGEISGREYFKYVCTSAERDHGIRIDLRELARHAAQGEVLNPAMIDLVAELHEQHTTALVTNNVAGAAWRETFPYQHFDHVIDSSVLGVRKPDPKIYQELLRVLDRPAGEVAFVDDFAENLPPATELGITVVHFESAEQCRGALADAGAL